MVIGSTSSQSEEFVYQSSRYAGAKENRCNRHIEQILNARHASVAFFKTFFNVLIPKS
jgi:hypothetical protein